MRIGADGVKTTLLVGALAAGLLAFTTVFGPPAGGLSESEAIKIATRDARASSVTAPHLILARRGHLAEFRDGASDAAAPPNRWVWAVVFSGQYPSSGGPFVPAGERQPGPVFSHSRLVVIDYRTGEFVMAQEPSPIPWGIGLN